MALNRLQKEYKQLLKDPNYMFNVIPSEQNFFVWDIILFGSIDTIFEGGIFKAQLSFPKEYPNRAPEFKFITQIPHPNFYKNGKVCISILHEGVDEFKYESISERWMPSHSVSTILMSIATLFTSPNLESPADIDASLEWKNNWNSYKNKIYKLVALTQNNI
jgi:ubiquitin-conjugating enzyme E2 G1